MIKASLKNTKYWFTLAVVICVSAFVPFMLNAALVHYAQTGNASMVGHLLAFGVSPSDDALGTAAYEGHITVVHALLLAGANPNAANDIDETALEYAAINSHTDVVKMLLDYGANPNWGCREMDALSLARMGKQTEMVLLLKKAGAKE